MRLIGLGCRNFAMFAELGLDLAGIEEAAITGENGVGKSRLLDAVVWCLYGRPARGTTDVLLRDGQLAMWVATTWTRGESLIEITRTRSVETKAGDSSLEVVVDGHRLTRHTITETQAVVTALIGLTREQLLATSFSAQGDSDALMRLRSGPRWDLILALFDLARMVPWSERAKEWLAQAERQISVLDDRHQRLTDYVAGEAAQREAHATASANLKASSGVVDSIQAEIDRILAEGQKVKEDALRAMALGRQITAATTAADEAAAEATRYDEQARRWEATTGLVLPELPAQVDHGAEEALRAEVRRSLEASRSKAAVQTALPLNQRRLAEAQAHLDTHTERMSALCATCPYREAPPTVELDALRAEIERAPVLIAEADAVMAAASGSQERLDALLAAAGAYDAALGARQAAATRVAEAHERLAETRTHADAARAREGAHRASLPAMEAERAALLASEGRARELADEHRAATVQMGPAKDALAECQRRFGAIEELLTAIDSAKVDLAKVVAERATLTARVEGLRQVAKMFHRTGLPTAILVSSLPAVERRANESLTMMPGDMALRFSTQSLTKRGTWSDEFDIEVVEAGRVRDYDVMSGAERFRVDFALRSALGGSIAHRTGQSFETLWVDEGFSAQSRTAIVDVLATLSVVARDFGLALATTHQEEVASRFSRRIELEAIDADTSTATVR